MFDWAIPGKKTVGGVEDMEFPRVIEEMTSRISWG